MNTNNHKRFTEVYKYFSDSYEQLKISMKDLYFCQVTLRKDYLKSLTDNGTLYYADGRDTAERYVDKVKKCNHDLKIKVCSGHSWGYIVQVDYDDPKEEGDV